MLVSFMASSRELVSTAAGSDSFWHLSSYLPWPVFDWCFPSLFRAKFCLASFFVFLFQTVSDACRHSSLVGLWLMFLFLSHGQSLTGVSKVVYQRASYPTLGQYFADDNLRFSWLVLDWYG